MGFLATGMPLSWKESLPFIAAIKRRGIQQFIQLYHEYRDFLTPLRWGDEVEVIIIDMDAGKAEVRLSLDAPVLIPALNEAEQSGKCSDLLSRVNWQPEYASYMVEMLPGNAAELNPESWLCVLPSMRNRRQKLQAALKPGKYVMSLTAFPLLGATNYIPSVNKQHPDALYSQSIFLSDQYISPHPRFSTLTANIRRRRGRKVEILAPLYIDSDVNVQNKPSSSAPVFESGLGSSSCILFKDVAASETRKSGGKTGLMAKYEDQVLNRVQDTYIYMDCMCFGMGMSCCQSTFSCGSLSDARYLYDQLIVFSPLLLALTASTPFARGCVTATDTRWDMISMSVDSRTEDEQRTIPKSRYSSNSLYISDCKALLERESDLNDLYVPVNEKAYDALIRGGVDTLLARHIGMLFVHDPMVIFKDRALKPGQSIDEIAEEGLRDWGLEEGVTFSTTEDFENIQSTNWNAVRFKPPPKFLKSDLEKNDDQKGIGWRVELRTAETQITDFENSVFTILSAALVQVVLEEKLDFYIPMSLNDENMRRAACLNSVLNQRFWFRRDIRSHTKDKTFSEFSLHQILFGEEVAIEGGPIPSHEECAGILTVCKQFYHRKLYSDQCSVEALKVLEDACDFVYMRTSGEIPTDASFLRACLGVHPHYRSNSTIPPRAAFDICNMVVKAGAGKIELPELLGRFAPCAASGCLRTGVKQSSVYTSDSSCSEKCCSPCRILHGNGKVSRALQHPNIVQRLRSHMI